MDVNSQNYSAIKTPVPPGAKLPQIIVQMPVYKESLEEVRARGRGPREWGEQQGAAALC
jgi:hypothetical protein